MKVPSDLVFMYITLLIWHQKKVGNIIYIEGEPVKMTLRSGANHLLKYILMHMFLQYNVLYLG